MNTRKRLPGWLTLSLGVLAWVIAVGYGFTQVWKYSTTPGAESTHPAYWPVESRITHTANRATLVMFVHPKCPCSRASLSELGDIARSSGRTVDMFIVFLRPENMEAGWEQTDTWTTAQRMPNAHVLIDQGGTEAARFGADTSGQLLLYDAGGALTFAGGITESRGHEGDNVGLRQVLALVDGRPASRHETNVFGCPLTEPGL